MTHDTSDDTTDATDTDHGGGSRSRRQFIAAAGATAAATALAGCGGDGNGTANPSATPAEYDAGDASMNELVLSEFQGSGAFVDGRPAPGGRSMSDLPNLSGELAIYLGGGEGGLYTFLFDKLTEIYPDFSYSINSGGSSEISNKIIEESKADQVSADLFISIGAGSLGAVTEGGATTALSSETVDPVPSAFVEPNRQWVGLAGRARSIPYNTDMYSESDLPDKVADFPSTSAFQGEIGWAPTYGAFQDFVTAMRLNRGEEATKEWLNGIQDLNVARYPDEFVTSDAIANGELGIGFANHYYALRVRAGLPDAPLSLHFTEGDAGSLINVSGASILSGRENTGLADVFVRHLLSAEAQEFFATTTYAYPMIPGVQPVGGLPTIDELNTPDIDLTKLSETGPTVSLMTEAGVL